ncbi:ABC transporter permease [Dactylosporangium sp. CA-233914]|uniref:ABC transporter permease n=1 Tax=Dactylosporangium sp. CA-233914 TaxID=3239934 RepID=UPI003D94421C
MKRLILNQVLAGFCVVLGALTLVFFMVRLGSDPTAIILPQDAPESARVSLRAELGLDRPLAVQYFDFVLKALRGDLGTSYFDSTPVSKVVLQYLPNTLMLAGTSFVVTLLIAIPLGTLAAVRRGRAIDSFVQAAAVFGTSIPGFWSGLMLLQVFAVGLGWFPTYGSTGPSSIVLPTACLVIFLFPTIARLTRSSVLETLSQPYVETARAKGAGEFRVVAIHVMRNALIPIVVLAGIQLGGLLGGAVITEAVFAWPGIGTLAIQSISRSDYPVVQGVVIYASLIYVAESVVTEILAASINPRLRGQQ